jgi:hypothetical protein
MFLNLSHLTPIQAEGNRAAALPEVQAAMETATFITCNVCNGRGDLQYRLISGVWNHRTMYSDRCFGLITQRWQPLR